MSENVSYFPARPEHLDALAALIRTENDDPAMSADYLRWWYFQNPSRSFSFHAAQKAGELCGMATTNNFAFDARGVRAVAAMPQKVLAARSVRGQGVFGKLYWATEADNLTQGVEFFVTFTNEMSTPIFLGKFGYARGQSPAVLWLPPSPLRALAPKRFGAVESLDEEFFRRGTHRFENSINKSYDYFLWRYLSHDARSYTVLEVSGGGGTRSPLGYVFLKRITKRGLPLYLLMDAAARGPEDLSSLVGAGLAYASRSLSLGLLMFENAEAELKGLFALRTGKQFNFLVKGKTEAETRSLAATRFNFFWGDLDFI